MQQGEGTDDALSDWRVCPQCGGNPPEPQGDGSGWDGTSMHTPTCEVCNGRGVIPACTTLHDSCHGDPEVDECVCKPITAPSDRESDTRCDTDAASVAYQSAPEPEWEYRAVLTSNSGFDTGLYACTEEEAREELALSSTYGPGRIERRLKAGEWEALPDAG